MKDLHCLALRSIHSLKATALPRDYLHVSTRQYTVFLHNSRRKRSISGFRNFQLGKFEFDYSKLFLTWRLSSFLRISVKLIFSKFVNNLSISLDKSTEICWNTLSTKINIFCWEQLKIICNLTNFNKFAQNKNSRQ